MKSGQMADAIAQLEAANSLSPYNTERLVMLGDAFFQTGDNAKAKSYYAQAMNLDSHAKDAQMGMGQVMVSEGDLNGALELLRNSASEDEAVAFFNNAAVLAVQKKKIGESFRLYESALKALKTDRLKPQVYFNLALAFKRLDKIEDALKACRRALKYAPDFDKAQRLGQWLEEIAAKRSA